MIDIPTGEVDGWLNPAALTFYAAVLVALITAIMAPIVQARLTKEAEARRAEIEAKVKQADEDHETTKWLRTQVGVLQERVDRHGRTTEQLKNQIAGLQAKLRERDSDDSARDGRIGQLEEALLAARIPVPPPAPDYARLVARELRARHGHG